MTILTFFLFNAVFIHDFCSVCSAQVICNTADHVRCYICLDPQLINRKSRTVVSTAVVATVLGNLSCFILEDSIIVTYICVLACVQFSAD